MEIEYERSLNRNYMILKNMEDFCEDYQLHMLAEQKIAHILPVDLRYMNGKPELYYDISSKQKLSEWLKIKKLKLEVFEEIIRSLKGAFEAGIDYLLECNCFILDARYMFIDVETYELSLCYYPLNNKDITQAGQEFLQYILEMLDYDDKKAVEEAYEIFRLCMRDGFSLELLKKFLDEKEKPAYDKEKNEEVDFSEGWVQVVPVSVADEEVWEEREEFGFIPLNLLFRRKCVVALAALELVCLLAVLLFFRKTFFAWITLGIVTLLDVGAILLLTVFYERIMQFTTLLGIKKNISYSDEAENNYNQVETEDKHIMGDVQMNFTQNEVRDKERPETEETILLGYASCNAGIRRLHYIGEGTQEDIVITKNPFVVGKSQKDTDYKLDYPFISRMHLRIDEKAGEYYITDTNSKNGIMLNREYLNANETARLEEGDRVEIGNLVFQFR